jgi:hypothetical protein
MLIKITKVSALFTKAKLRSNMKIINVNSQKVSKFTWHQSGAVYDNFAISIRALHLGIKVWDGF